MGWKRRMIRKKDGSYKIVEPEETDIYWVTDGASIWVGLFNKKYRSWGIYQADPSIPQRNFGKLVAIHIDDMNIEIKAWCKLQPPTIPKNLMTMIIEDK